MKKDKFELSIPNLIKYILAAIVLLLALYVTGMLWSKGNVIDGVFALFVWLFFCLILGILLLPDIINKIGNKGGELYYPNIDAKVARDYSHAKAHLIACKYQEAIEEYKKALEEDPEDITAQSEIANIYAEHIKDYPKAIEEYNKTLSMEPEETIGIFIQHRLADIYSQHMNDNNSAVDALQKIMDKFPPGHKYTQQAYSRIERLKKS